MVRRSPFPVTFVVIDVSLIHARLEAVGGDFIGISVVGMAVFHVFLVVGAFVVVAFYESSYSLVYSFLI